MLELPTKMWMITLIFGRIGAAEQMMMSPSGTQWVRMATFLLEILLPIAMDCQKKRSLMVKDLVPGALAPPTSFTEIWTDRGSGAYEDVKVMKMNPRSGYTCLGHVAVKGYRSIPNNYNYR